MSIPHPFVTEGSSISLNPAAIAEEAMRRIDLHKVRGHLFSPAMVIEDVISEAELIRHGKRFERHEGGTATLVKHGSLCGLRDDVPEAHMNAAQDAFGATDRATLDKLRAVVRAVRAIDKAALDACYTAIAAEGGASSDTYSAGFNAAICTAMGRLEQIDARDTRIASPIMPANDQITLATAAE